MVGIEMQFMSNGRRVSLDDFAEIVAGKVATRVVRELAEKIVPPQPRVQEERNPEAMVVSIPDAARLLGLSSTTIWQYIKEKRIDAIHIGPRCTRIRMETIKRIVTDGIRE
jgi:excisionase family DNA binding protein